MSEIIYDFLFNFSLSALATLSFAIIFNSPRKELLHCAFTGAIGWIVYFFTLHETKDSTISTFLGALTVATFSRLFSYSRRAPSTLFLIPGIIPLVPGSQMYNTMTAILDNNMYGSYLEAVKAFKLAGVIAIGIIVIFTLPYKTFAIIRPKSLKKPK